MGVYDLSAEIDHILTNTSANHIHYVGHSMGSTMFYVLMSMKPEYNAKIRHMVALAPVAFLRNIKTPFASTTKLLFSGVSILKMEQITIIEVILSFDCIFSGFLVIENLTLKALN
jgi:lysosomal acid lipase/cholesteryl ester hydrolase